MMSVADVSIPTFRDLVASNVPPRSSFDPFGLVSGFRMYQVFTHLSEMGNDELAAMGIDRKDIPRIASETVLGKL